MMICRSKPDGCLWLFFTQMPVLYRLPVREALLTEVKCLFTGFGMVFVAIYPVTAQGMPVHRIGQLPLTNPVHKKNSIGQQ